MVKDQYTFTSNYNKLKILALQSNTVIKVLPDGKEHEYLIGLFIIDKEIIPEFII